MSTHEKILVVDDDPDFVRSTTDLLEAHGYSVVSASDGAAGLELAKKLHPNLMVLDVMMATRTEGFEIARRIPSCPELRNMPVLLVTGIRNDMKLGFRLEPDETWLPVSRVMEKPIDPAAFIAAVGELLRTHTEIDGQHGALKLVKGILATKDPGLCTVPPETTILSAVEMMAKQRIGSLLVVREGKLAGICTDRDCLRAVVLRDRPAKTTILADIMTSPPVCVCPDDTAEECISIMMHKRIRHLPVLDDGRLVGILSLGDMVRAAVAEKNSMIEQLEKFIMTG